MIDKLINLDEVGNILGFSDHRSTKKWCNKNNIQVLRAGKKSYVLSAMLDYYFEKETEKFFNSKFPNPTEIMDALRYNNRSELVDLINAPATEKVKKDYIKKEHSAQSKKFLERIKAA